MPHHDYYEPIEVTTLVQQVTQRIYDQYRARVSVGDIIPPLSHAANADFVGPARISDPTVQLPYPPPPFYAPAEYITHAHIDKPSRHGERQVEVAIIWG